MKSFIKSTLDIVKNLIYLVVITVFSVIVVFMFSLADFSEETTVEEVKEMNTDFRISTLLQEGIDKQQEGLARYHLQSFKTGKAAIFVKEKLNEIFLFARDEGMIASNPTDVFEKSLKNEIFTINFAELEITQTTVKYEGKPLNVYNVPLLIGKVHIITEQQAQTEHIKMITII
ncbi:hypothetical protein GCM10007425_07850 [Lysinibacillus alkalisoli]|uniref:Uncharacterized protein n=1 Tax=Lysinibacillus alkalisoli TaxID=1911548 RepID=A0A917LEM9_9BACI|nr:hypothetical protein [Lysinibacillus alkalisoli]GGG15972.1 hypothetical protein GCM10007425_07850 [Lysinibacillus alkalisoli]